MIKYNYDVIEKRQKEVFENVYTHFSKATDKLVISVEKAANTCNKSAKRAEDTAEELYKAESWRDLMYYAAPALVLIDVIIRIAPWIIGFFK